MTHYTLSRRALVAGMAGGAAALMLPGRQARAAGGEIVVSNWGGDWNDRTQRLMEKPLLEDRGFVLSHDLGMEADRKAKLMTEKRIRRASVDVVHLNSADAFEMHNQGVVADLDMAKIPNAADIVPGLEAPYFIPWLYSGVVIIYNRDKVKAPPRSYADLWKPEWAGRIGLTNQLYFNYMMMGGLVAKGDMTSVDAGKDRMLDFAATQRPRLYAAHQQLQTGLANGEVDIAVNYKARGLQWAAGGMPLGIQYPEEGAISTVFGACLAEYAPHRDGGYAYLDAMLDPGAMARLSEASFYAPANTRAELSPELRDTIDFSDTERAALRYPDYAYVARNTADWLDWWTQSFARD
ncbi:ABC transporter substrate-binding protein [Pseudodonghicola xiamenensis]|uniref:ABC transporter substrate-binding protein n=1 Tax=Pseudodonghicola xiamenensis TaxID=337702 RepID=A0A8J3H9N5_9RHOB|nr:extracellular solute-binding protein [Pseudodonghicola xiamenensis]GHG98102.1 ABC transporter substrate-binding protein [Pseudodonghicola xiamenensis]